MPGTLLLKIQNASKPLVAIAMVVFLLFPQGFAPAAFAETDNIEADVSAAQEQVEQTAQAYNEAIERIEEIERDEQANQARIEQLEAQLPEQQERSDYALCLMYKMQKEGFTLIDLVFSAQDFSQFLRDFEYFSRVQETIQAELNALILMRQELEETKLSLATERAQAEQARADAEDALAQAQAAREAAQAAAQAKAEAEAAVAAAEAEAAAAAAEEEKQAETEESAGQDGGSSSSESVTPPAGDGADWSQDKASFVSAWAGRIDAYFAGTPLSGYGATFAAAAWDYGIDPRFSPAISAVESSKGLYCYRSYNAWGWGGISWDSWEEAIDAHVRGLSRGYGYTVSVEGAKKYCPPNWEHWYNRVSEEMNKI